MMFRRIRVVHTKVIEEETVETLREKLKAAEERAAEAEEVLERFKSTDYSEVMEIIISKILTAITSDQAIEDIASERYELATEDDLPPGSWEELSEESKDIERDSLRTALEFGLQNMEMEDADGDEEEDSEKDPEEDDEEEDDEDSPKEIPN